MKYEDIYLQEYDSPVALHEGLSRYFDFYLTQRPLSSLGYRTPAELYGKSTQTET